MHELFLAENNQGSKDWEEGFPGDSVVKNLLASAGDTGSISDAGRSRVPWNWPCVPQLLSLSSRAREPHYWAQMP